MSQTQIAAALALACFLGGFLSGYKVDNMQQTAKAETAARKASEAAIKQRDDALAAYLHLAGELSAKTDQHAADLKKAQNETNDLRDRANRGAIGLRLAGTCPTPSQATPAPGSRVGFGTGAELDSTARRAYFALRDGIDQATAKLAACQSQLTARAE